MEPKIVQIKGFSAKVKTIRTTNLDGKSLADQGALWQEEIEKGLLAQGRDVVGIYGNYEGDFMAPFDFSLGVLAQSGQIPGGGYEIITVESGSYALFEEQAPTPEAAAGKIWQRVWQWQSSHARGYKTDFEIWSHQGLITGQVKVSVHISLA